MNYYLHPTTNELIIVDGESVVHCAPLRHDSLTPLPENPTHQFIDGDEFTDAEEKPKKIKKEKRDKKIAGGGRFEVKECCGSKGPRHRATCRHNTGKPVQNGMLPADTKRMGAMTQKQFSQVKISLEHELPADTVAREMSLPLREVERAILAQNYEAYSAKL